MQWDLVRSYLINYKTPGYAVQVQIDSAALLTHAAAFDDSAALLQSIDSTRTTPLHIATWNVNSITKRLPMLRIWSRHPTDGGADIIILQETSCNDERFNKKIADSVRKAGYHVEHYGAKGGNGNGVAILSRFSISNRLCIRPLRHNS